MLKIAKRHTSLITLDKNGNLINKLIITLMSSWKYNNVIDNLSNL